MRNKTIIKQKKKKQILSQIIQVNKKGENQS